MSDYNVNLLLKNKSEWISYMKKIINGTNKSGNELLEEILTFPFEFGAEPNLRECNLFCVNPLN